MGPPLPPVQCGFQLSTGLARAPIQIELFHDLVCPFSCKMFKTVFHEVIPKCSGNVQFVLQPVPQPWHPQGTYVHEAALAVKQVAPTAYPAYVDAVFTAYSGGSFKDDTTWDKSRAQIYDELLALLSSGPPELATVDAAAVKELLTLKFAQLQILTPSLLYILIPDSKGAKLKGQPENVCIKDVKLLAVLAKLQKESEGFELLFPYTYTEVLSF